MQNNPQISVIMSTYSRNRSEGSCPNLLMRALDSILAQTFEDFELVLIDDGSKDGSVQVCREYSARDHRIKFYRFDPNSGLPAKRYNDGILLSKAPYITFMFDDDKWYPNALKYLHESITTENSDCGMVYGLTNYMNAKTNAPLQLNFGADWSWEVMDKQNFLCNNSVIVKRYVIDDVGGYDEEPIMRRLCDWDLWWRIGRKFKVKRITKLIGEVYAFHEDSIGVMVEYDYPAIKAHQVRENRRVRLQGELKKKIIFTFVHHGHDSALQRWRIWYLSEELNKQGHTSICIHLNDGDFKSKCMASDVIIFYRCYQPLVEFIRKLVSLNKLVIYDIDDYVFQSGAALFNSKGEATLINEYLREVNCYSASTETLLEQMPQNDRPRFIRVNAIDQDTFNLLSNPNMVMVNKKRYRIGWTTGINRVEMQNFVESFLGILNSKIQGGCEFWYFGKNDSFYRGIQKFKNIQIVKLNYINTGNWKQFYKDLKMAMFDVVINPLEESNIFFHCKSGIKAIEHGSLGYPLITSRVKPFTEFIKEGVNGYFASTPQEFVNKVLHIKSNAPESIVVANRLRQYVADNFMIEKVVDKFIQDCIHAQIVITCHVKKKLIDSNYVNDFVCDNFGYVTEEILTPLLHEFTSQVNGLCRVEFLGTVLNKGSNAAVKFILKDKNSNEIIWSKIYNVRDFQNNSWWGFEFPSISQSKGVKFEAAFIPQEIEKGNSFQLYMSLLPHTMSNFWINGKRSEGHLAFKSFATSTVGKLPEEKKPIVVESSTIEHSTVKSEEQKRIEQITRILIRKKGSWGDIVPLFPIIKYLKTKDSSTQIFLATNHQCLFENNEYIEETIPWESNVSNLNHKIDLENAHENDPKSHIVDAYAKLIIGHSDIDKTIEIKEAMFDREYIEHVMLQNGLKDKEFLVFHCALTHKNKTWPREKWNRLQAHCIAQGTPVVVVGSGSDFVPVISGIVNLVNKINFFQSKYLIEKAKAIVCLDGDYMQIAGATETPIIGLFTATSSRYKLPYRKGQLGFNCHAIEAPIECTGCWNNHIKPIKYFGCANGSFSCLNSITPQMVLQRINIP
jgi:ADP-heptose:LPS heptosyltransferase